MAKIMCGSVDRQGPECADVLKLCMRKSADVKREV